MFASPLIFAILSAPPTAPVPVKAPTQSEIAASLFRPVEARQMGPTNMGGRIASISVFEKDPRIFFVAGASGGIFKTVNGGITFTPVFDKQGSASIGAVAVSQTDQNLVWVGGGEVSSRNSVAWGDGIYKSTDGGKTWTHMGLKASNHIASIVIDSKNNNRVTVAVLGHLWGPNEERGIYQTEDGGKTWKRILNVDSKTGFIDLVADPKNPNVMVAAAWQRDRKPWTFVSSGPGSGLYRTSDGGKSWSKISKGLPEGDLGRIGLSVSASNPKVWVATIAAEKGGTYRSTDGGVSWERRSAFNARPFYFSRPVIDPVDENRVYFAGVSLHYSVDQGKTVREMHSSVHVDYHAIWVDPKDNQHILVGNDGGLGQSRDRGGKWEHFTNLSLAQYYGVAVDNRRPYWAFGGLQDNGSWGVPTQSVNGAVGFWDSVGVGGGDGFYCQVDPNDPYTVYSESQGGFAYRADLKTGTQRSIQPSLKGTKEELRFNWNTPIHLSPFNSKTVYIGANRLMRSVNRGNTWLPISPDLSTNNAEKLKSGEGSSEPESTGAESHCTITTISESPMKEGLIWAGTDDGNVQLTQDGGKTWSNVIANIKDLPKNTWCSRVVASKWVENRAYATFDGHRMDDYKPYIYRTDDLGKTWKALNTGLPDGDSLYVVREGEKNKELLYLGSEFALRVSLDAGANWNKFTNNFPTVAVHDLVVHPRDLDMVLATHGRGLYSINVSAWEALTTDKRAKPLVVLPPQDILQVPDRSDKFGWGDSFFLVKNTQPGTQIFYHLAKETKDEVKVVVTDPGETREYLNQKGTGNQGLNSIVWKPSSSLPAGDYRVKVTVGTETSTTSVKVIGFKDLDGI